MIQYNGGSSEMYALDTIVIKRYTDVDFIVKHHMNHFRFQYLSTLSMNKLNSKTGNIGLGLAGRNFPHWIQYL